MRYVVLVAMSIFSAIFSGSIFSNLNIAGIQIDIVLLVVLALVFVDKSAAPIIFAAATGILMDILYSSVLGMYAVSYTVAVAVVYIIIHRMEKFKFFQLFLIGVGGYLLKEMVMAFIVFVQGARFDFLNIFVRYMLPSAALNGALLLLMYFLFSRLYRNAWMRPRVSASSADEFL